MGGPVHCLGRADSQVKIRGFRVELEEIAAVLAAQPGVAAAAVSFASWRTWTNSSPSWCRQCIGKRARREWRQALAARLPAYMVPAHFELAAALPRLASGKIDRKALEAMPLKVPPANGPATAGARNDDEAALFAALATIFPGQTFGPELDFFDDSAGIRCWRRGWFPGCARMPATRRWASRPFISERRLAGIAGAMARQRGQAKPSAVPWPRRHALGRRFACGT